MCMEMTPYLPAAMMNSPNAKCSTTMSDEYDIKVRGKLGPEKADNKAIAILNRCMEWTSQGIQCEANPRHVELLINEMEFHNTKPSLVPGSKEANIDDDKAPHLDASRSTTIQATHSPLQLLVS